MRVPSLTWSSRTRRRSRNAHAPPRSPQASRVHQIYHVSYFTAESISRLLEQQGFETLAILPDETITGLLNEPLVVRVGVRIVFALSTALGLQNKMIVVAKLRDERDADAARESS